jgi:hypothetical protein
VKRRLITALIVGHLFSFLSYAQAGKTVYLSTLEDDDSSVAVYQCKDNQCVESQVKLRRSADIQITGKEFSAQTTDPFDDSKTKETFVPVKFNNGVGYLPLYLLSEKKLTAFYAEEKDERMPAAAGAAVAKPVKKPGSLKAATQIYDLVGECPLKDPTAMPAKLPKENVFDSYLYVRLKKQKVPRLVNEQMKAMTTDDLINIDALARTIYGEMGKCFRKGLQYPIAAALVAVNRFENRARFREWTNTQVKRKVASIPNLTKIVTTPEKFNVWKAYQSGKINAPLHHSLCPARVTNKPFWKAKKASQAEVDIWKNAVRIATEAVMFPTRFKARSPAMKNINFYTSGMGQYQNYLQVFPFVNDRPLENFSCIEMWQEPGK